MWMGKSAPFRLLGERLSVGRPHNLIGVDNGQIQAGGRRSGEPFMLWRIDARVDRVSRVLFGAQMSTSSNGSSVRSADPTSGHHLQLNRAARGRLLHRRGDVNQGLQPGDLFQSTIRETRVEMVCIPNWNVLTVRTSGEAARSPRGARRTAPGSGRPSRTSACVPRDVRS